MNYDKVEDTFFEAFDKAAMENGGNQAKAMLACISGFSPFLCKMIVNRACSLGVDTKAVLRAVCKDIVAHNYAPVTFAEGDFHAISFENKEFDTVNEMLDAYYSPKEQEHAISQKTGEMQKHLQSAINKTLRKIELHKQVASDAENYDINRIKGELLLANMYAIRDFHNEVELDNLYDMDENSMPKSKITIELDENKTIAQNAQIYFKKYQKQKATYENALIYYDEDQKELEYLTNVAALLKNVTNDDEILQIKEELTEE